MAETKKKAEATEGVAPSKPGEVIAPGGTSTPTPPSVAPAQTPAEPTPAVVAKSQPVATQTNLNPADNPNEPVAATSDSSPASNKDGITWTASEFVAHEKSAGWYLALTVVALVIAGVIYLLTRDIIS